MLKKMLPLSLTIIYIISFIVTFNAFLMGSDVEAKNIIVCIIYLIVWVLYIYYDINRVFSYFYWVAALASSISIVIVNLTNIDLVSLIPLDILFLTPLYCIFSLFDSSISICIISILFIGLLTVN